MSEGAEGTSDRTACIHCDLVLVLGRLAEGERATCPRCGHMVASRTENGMQRALAFALAAVVLLVMANAFPFLAIQASGLESVMTIPEAAVQIHRDGYLAMAVIVMAVIVVVPAVMLGLLLLLVGSLVRRRNRPWLVPVGRLFFWLTPWSMVEVFVIAVIVSLVKIGHMATVVFGFSFFSYVAFAVCFIAALSSLDRLEVWEEIEALRS